MRAAQGFTSSTETLSRRATRQVAVVRTVAPSDGVPLRLIRAVIGNRPMFGMEITKAQFAALLDLF
jgi:hypothetical protein